MAETSHPSSTNPQLQKDTDALSATGQPTLATHNTLSPKARATKAVAPNPGGAARSLAGTDVSPHPVSQRSKKAKAAPVLLPAPISPPTEESHKEVKKHPLPMFMRILLYLCLILAMTIVGSVLLLAGLAKKTPGFALDHHLIDGINLGGVLLGVLGLFYVTYELFGRSLLTWFIRIITPGLMGAIILAPAGLLLYAYLLGFTGQILRGGGLFALVGVMIGIFNGLLIDWPPPMRRPHPISWKGGLLGVLVVFLIWFIADSVVLGDTLETAFLEGAILSPTGLIAGSFWRFINWGPPPSALDKPPTFSWKGCLSGVFLAFLIGTAAYYCSGGSLRGAFVEGTLLVPTGGITGGLWHFIKGEPAGDKPPLFSWKGCLIGLISAFIFGFVSAFIVDLTYDTSILGAVIGGLTAAAFIGPAGAITGGSSRFIFWRANQLDPWQLGGIGAILTLFGFLLQILAPVVSLLEIPVR